MQNHPTEGQIKSEIRMESRLKRFRTLVLASFVRNHAVGRESKENEND